MPRGTGGEVHCVPLRSDSTVKYGVLAPAAGRLGLGAPRREGIYFVGD